MPTPIGLSVGIGMPRAWGCAPVKGCVFTMDWSKDISFVADINQLGNLKDFPVLGMAFDNSLVNGIIRVQSGAPFGQSFSLPAKFCGRLPFETGDGAQILFASVVGAGITQVTLLNDRPDPILYLGG